MADEWSTDRGVGCKYFSQDAVIKLAPQAGIQLDEGLTPAEKLKVIQGLMEQDDARAVAIYDSLVHIWLTRWYFIASSMSCATSLSWAGSCPARVATGFWSDARKFWGRNIPSWRSPFA